MDELEKICEMQNLDHPSKTNFKSFIVPKTKCILKNLSVNVISEPVNVKQKKCNLKQIISVIRENNTSEAILVTFSFRYILRRG